MTGHLTLPRAVEPFVAFSSVLRANGFAVAPEQTQSFVAAVGLLGPRSMQDIYRAALATLAPPPERREEFDALYRMVFLGQSVAVADGMPDEDDVRAYDERDGQSEGGPPEKRGLRLEELVVVECEVEGDGEQ